jgi:mycothiol synthase
MPAPEPVPLDPSGDLVAVDDPRAARRALALLAPLGDERGEAVDASEIARLERLADDRAPAGWDAVMLVADAGPCGYAGLRDTATARWTGEVAAATHTVTQHLLEHLAARARASGAALEVWVRRRDASAIAALETAAGFVPARRLAVLTLALDHRADVDGDREPTVIVRAARAEDLDRVASALDAAYRGTPDGPWNRARLDGHMAAPWFRPDDLLVAEDTTGAIVGVHWLKRRSERIGEVHNLAVVPDAHGRRVGAQLLDAGLAHLRRTGVAEVVLWVDLANPRAERLYRSRGFTRAWLDVCLALADQASSGPRDAR